MDPAIFDSLQQTITSQGPRPAIEQLCATLRERREYASLFYAMLMQKRHELGISPLPTGPASEIPLDLQEKYEDGIRDAGRTVGRLFLDAGNLPQAYSYFRMLGEPQPVAEALEKYTFVEGEDAQGLIELAFHHGANPRRGMEWILEKFGICSAITIMGGALGSGQFPAEAREACVKELVRSLHNQLIERLRYDITRKEGQAPETRSVRELIAGRDWLFEDDNYHVDTSHLSSVVQMCSQLPKCTELELAREMCAYGLKLSPQFQGQGEPPFESLYEDMGHYFGIIAGDQVDAGVAHFRKKAENPDPDYGNNPAAEMLVNTLLQLNRPADALAIARQFLTKVDDKQLTCPPMTELCRKLNDYRALAEVARERGDPVHFLAGLIAAANGK